MNNNKLNFTVNTIIRVFVLASFFIIAAFSLFNRGRVGYSESFLTFAAIGSGLGIIVTVALIVLDLLKNKLRQSSEILTLGHIGEESKLNIISNPITKLVILLVWGIFMTIAPRLGLKVWSDPSPYTGGVSAFATEGSLSAVSQFSLTKTLFDTAFIPAFTEDIMAYALSIGIVMIFALVLFMMSRTSRLKFLTPFKIQVLFPLILIANAISAFVFSNAHEIVAGTNISFLLQAWFFQFINLTVYWMTYFIPIAHFGHNLSFALGFAISFSIAFAFIPIMSKNIIKKILSMGSKNGV